MLALTLYRRGSESWEDCIETTNSIDGREYVVADAVANVIRRLCQFAGPPMKMWNPCQAPIWPMHHNVESITEEFLKKQDIRRDEKHLQFLWAYLTSFFRHSTTIMINTIAARVRMRVAPQQSSLHSLSFVLWLTVPLQAQHNGTSELCKRQEKGKWVRWAPLNLKSNHHRISQQLENASGLLYIGKL